MYKNVKKIPDITEPTHTILCHQHVPNSFDAEFSPFKKLKCFIWPHDVSTSLPSMQSGQPVSETGHWAPSSLNSCHPGLRRCRAARPEIGMLSLPVVSLDHSSRKNHKLFLIYPFIHMYHTVLQSFLQFRIKYIKSDLQIN